MRLKQLFLEYENIDQAKANILDQISNIDTQDEKGVKILDRVFKVLNSEQSGTSIQNAFIPPMADENMSDAVKKGHILKVASIISNVDTDFNALNKFLKRLESGKALNVDVFSKSVTTFNELCNGDPVAIKVLHSLMTYGKGIKRAGNGEFALAMMSPHIKISPGQGDLEIKGIKVELKAETTTGGGRMGSGGPTRDSQMKALKKYEEHIPEIVAFFEQGNKSMVVNAFVKLLNDYLPIGGQNIKIRQDIGTDIFSLAFGPKYGALMGKGFGQADPMVAKMNMVRHNFEWYKEHDSFEMFVVMSFPQEKIVIAHNGDELAAHFESGQLSGGGASFIHTGQSSEVFAQLNVPSTKV